MLTCAGPSTTLELRLVLHEKQFTRISPKMNFKKRDALFPMTLGR